MQLELFYDVASPYSYLASTQVEAIASDVGASVRWLPLLLGAVFQAVGSTTPASVPARRSYLLTDLQRWADYYGVPFAMSPFFLTSSLRPMRVLAGAPEADVAELTHRLFHALWVDGLDLREPSVLVDVVGAQAAARAEEDVAKATLRANTDEAIARGAFGAPTYFVRDAMYFGNDRLPFVEQALRRARG